MADTTGVTNQNYSLVGVNVTVPIFTGFSVGYGVRQAQGALQVSDANAEQIRLNVTQSVWSAYYSLDSANQQVTVTAGLIKTAQKNEEVALGRYQGGVGTIVDVLTAQAAAALARQTRIAAELACRQRERSWPLRSAACPELSRCRTVRRCPQRARGARSDRADQVLNGKRPANSPSGRP